MLPRDAAAWRKIAKLLDELGRALDKVENPGRLLRFTPEFLGLEIDLRQVPPEDRLYVRTYWVSLFFGFLLATPLASQGRTRCLPRRDDAGMPPGRFTMVS